MDLIFTDKILNTISLCLKDEISLIILEGQIRSAKTETGKVGFFERVQNSDERLHLLAAQDLDAVKDKFLDGPTGLLELYPQYLKLKRDEIGSYYLKCMCDVPGKPAKKSILLAGYADAGKWKKILGKTLGVIMVDEVNIASEQFIDECFARQTSANAPLQIWTLNGDVPTHWVYQKYINRAKPIWKVPASILADMLKVENVTGWYYTHWKMEDNPIMTPDKINKALSIYKPGTYYYTTKVLGERGSPGKMIYVDYLDSKTITALDTTQFSSYVVGVDIGASRAQNSFALVGFSRDFAKVGIIDLMTFQQVGYAEKAAKLEAFIRSWSNKLPIECVAVDSAEMNFIRDLKAGFSMKGLPAVIASYKATIKERIDLEWILLSADRLLFNDTEAGKEAYKAFQVAKWKEGKEGEEREDNNEPHIDILDSIEYALTRHMKKIIILGKVA